MGRGRRPDGWGCATNAQVRARGLDNAIRDLVGSHGDALLGAAGARGGLRGAAASLGAREAALTAAAAAIRSDVLEVCGRAPMRVPVCDLWIS